MKKLLLILMSVYSLSAFAQIKDVTNEGKYEEIGKVGGGSFSPFVSAMKVMRNADGKNNYLWMYNNLEYKTITDIKSISFTATEEEFEGLYKMLKEFMQGEKGAEKKLELGEQRVMFSLTKNLGVVTLYIYDLSGSGRYFMLTAKQLDKVFGK